MAQNVGRQKAVAFAVFMLAAFALVLSLPYLTAFPMALWAGVVMMLAFLVLAIGVWFL